MNHRRVCIGFLHLLLIPFLIFGLGISSALSAPQEMTPVDLLNLASLGESRISPDGKHIVFTRRDADWKENKQVTDLWLSSELDDKPEARQLTFTATTEKKLAWSPNGKLISFVSEKEKDKHDVLYALPIKGGESYPLIQHEADIKDYAWSADSKSIYFLANEPLDDVVIARKKDKDDMLAFEQSITYRHLWRADIESGEVTQLTDGTYFVTNFSLAEDNTIVFNKAAELTLDDRHSADIWLLTNTGSKPKRITNNNHAEYDIRISPDAKSVLFTADVNENGEYYYDANLFVLSLESGKVKPLALDQTFEVEDAAWSDKGESIYIRANMGVRSEIWMIDVNKDQVTQLTDSEQTVRSWHYNSNTDQHSFVIRTAKNPGEIWRMQGDGSGLKAITEVHAGIQDRYRIPEQKRIRWKSYDGDEVEGLLTLPLNYKKGKRVPLVTYTHGGPRSSDQYGQFAWRSAIPVYAGMGYAFFTPNYRGSRGYGDQFMRDMVGGYFNNAHLDVMSGIDFLIEQGIADPEQLVATGWSAGGHMTNKLITFTDRFKAASSGAGAIDWVSMYGHTDVRYGRTPWFGGTPWQQQAPLDVYRQHSPLKDLWKVTTPTLIFVGERDKRVPPAQSMILYRGLRDLGVESKLYIAPREPHGFRELRHRLFKINAELEWFDKHARQRTYKWQDIPKND